MSTENKYARKYFLDNNYNCAESVILAANEIYDLNIPIEAVRLLSGFGAGMSCGKTCGAIAGALAVISNITVKDRAHTTDGFKETASGLVLELEKVLGGTDCKDLMPKYRKPDVRCIDAVEIALEVLDRYIKDNDIII